jgi:putative aldouronate transport system permease protein
MKPVYGREESFMPVKHQSLGEKTFDVANIIMLTLLSLASLYPFLYVVFASFSDHNQLATHTGLIFKPLGFSYQAYVEVFKNPMITIGYKNTMIYVILGTSVNLLLTSLGAYVISRKQFLWRNSITYFILFTMFFHGGLIPTYLLVKNLGLINTVWAMVLPVAINTWNLLIMRTAFTSLPDSLEESAKIDGANDITILFKIILPLSMPVLAVMTLYYGVAHWNSWFNALIYMRARELFPLQLVLREILIVNSTESMTLNADFTDKESVGETIKYATIVVATLPILMAYPFMQRFFVKGVMIGSVKG